METVIHDKEINNDNQLKPKKKMKPLLKWTLIILAALTVIIVSILVYINSYINRSMAVIEGEITLSGLENVVEVVRDENGVPHIVAESDLDLFFAQGYITAQDRLFQMEMARRQASGRLSEVAGDAALNNDKYFRTLGLRRAAEKSLELYEDDVIEVLQAYADGVNAFIKEAEKKNALPIEFFLMGLDELEEWTPLDSLTIGKFMAYDLGGHWERQAFNYYLINHFDEEEAYELFPTYPENALTNISEQEYVDLTALSNAPLNHEFNGSNNWVVSGDKTESGYPILADDPHLGLATPSIWYQVHLQSPNYNVSGVIFAGVPGVILGHNEHIAWGVTNVGPDVQQLYLERRHDENPHMFLYDDEWYEADVIIEEIKVKDSDPVELEVVETIHGPVISEYANGVEQIEQNTVLSVQWTALQPTKELAAVLNFNRATNWEEFEKALEDFHAPAQNFVFASKDGTIAYKANGKIPLYEDPDYALLPLPGWDSEYTLTDYIPFDELPKVINPDKGFVASANNKVIDDVYPYHISHVWAQPYRYTRIHEVLEQSDQISVEDMMKLQMDQMNLQASQFVPVFLDILKDVELSDTAKKAYELLEQWDYIDDKDAPQPLIFHHMLKKIENELFEGKIPDNMLTFFKGMAQTVDQLIMKSYDGEHVIWIEKSGGLTQVVKNGLEKAVSQLETKHGKNLNEWEWGDYHRVYFAHPLSNISFLDRFFNKIEPIPVGGSNVTVMAASFRSDGIVNHGASWRFVIDLENSELGYHIVGPGQAGHYRSKWYDDQIVDWVEGNYHATSMKQFEGNKLLLKPEK